MYQYGNGVPENDAEAVKWYRLAAEQGNAIAQSSLSVMYYQGEGVPENYLTAYVWTSVSAAQGNQIAKGNVEIIKGTLTNENIKVLFLVGRYKFYHLLGNHSLPYYSTTVFI